MALNLNCIELDLNQPATVVVDTALGPVIRCWVPYMGWYYAKINPEATNKGSQYIPSAPCDPTPLLTLIDVL